MAPGGRSVLASRSPATLHLPTEEQLQAIQADLYSEHLRLFRDEADGLRRSSSVVLTAVTSREADIIQLSPKSKALHQAPRSPDEGEGLHVPPTNPLVQSPEYPPLLASPLSNSSEDANKQHLSPIYEFVGEPETIYEHSGQVELEEIDQPFESLSDRSTAVLEAFGNTVELPGMARTEDGPEV